MTGGPRGEGTCLAPDPPLACRGMARRRLQLLLLLLVLTCGTVGFATCDGSPSQTTPATTSFAAPGLAPLVAPLLEPSPAVLGEAPGGAEDEAHEAGEGHDPDDAIGLTWTMSPEELMVFRSTAVSFGLDSAPSDHPTASCSWNFGDGTPIEQGCSITHTFHGGRADQVVTLTLVDGDWSWTSTRAVPLERLPVVQGLLDESEAPETQALDVLPSPPEPAETSFRFALVADSAAKGGVPGDVTTAIMRLEDTVKPELVLHAGGVVVAGEGDDGWDVARAAFALLASTDIPVAMAMSRADRLEGASAPEPDLEMVDGRRYPHRYTFAHKGAFFLVFSADDEGSVSEETLDWMREELARARVYDARYVVSHLPLHKLTDEHLGSLDKKFRLYELFLRARVTALFHGGYRVYYRGRYGALPVISVGALAAPGGRLSGTDLEQPPSFVVVDQVRGVPERTFAVEGPTFDRVFDESQLPQTVEVYTK